jgi:hypothetical protein
MRSAKEPIEIGRIFKGWCYASTTNFLDFIEQMAMLARKRLPEMAGGR